MFLEGLPSHESEKYLVPTGIKNTIQKVLKCAAEKYACSIAELITAALFFLLLLYNITMKASTFCVLLLAILYQDVHVCSALSLRMSSSKNGNSIGLALAGGGNRASSACTGILRGFQQKQINTKDGKTRPAMDAVKYNSGISGGSIPAALYTFAQVPTDELLETDRLVDPGAITPELLETLPETSMGYGITTNPLRLPKAYMLPFLFRNVFKVHVSLLRRSYNCV
jgi:hypothetical protein